MSAEREPQIARVLAGEPTIAPGADVRIASGDYQGNCGWLDRFEDGTYYVDIGDSGPPVQCDRVEAIDG